MEEVVEESQVWVELEAEAVLRGVSVVEWMGLLKA